MKAVKIKKIHSLLDRARSKAPRAISESKFWGKIALQQQVLIHAKNKT